MCALESDWMRGGGTLSRRWMRQRRGRGRERWLYLSWRPTRRLSRFRTSAKCIAASLCEPNCNDGRVGFRALHGGVVRRTGRRSVEEWRKERDGATRVDPSRPESSQGSIPVVVRGKLCPFSSRGDPSTGAIFADTGEFCARSWRRQRRRRIIPHRKVTAVPTPGAVVARKPLK